MKLVALGSFITPDRDKVSYVEYLKNPKTSYAMKKLENQWNSKDSLRLIANTVTRDFYVFPYWVLHADFIEDELGLDYETLMDGSEYIFASIEAIPDKDNPQYALTDSSQFLTLLKRFCNDHKKTQEYLEDKLAFLREYNIEPTKYIKLPKLFLPD